MPERSTEPRESKEALRGRWEFEGGKGILLRRDIRGTKGDEHQDGGTSYQEQIPVGPVLQPSAGHVISPSVLCFSFRMGQMPPLVPSPKSHSPKVMNNPSLETLGRRRPSMVLIFFSFSSFGALFAIIAKRIAEWEEKGTNTFGRGGGEGPMCQGRRTKKEKGQSEAKPR